MSLVAGMSFAGIAMAEGPVRVTSPDGKLTVEFSESASDSPTYRVTREGRPLLSESKLGLIPEGAPAYADLRVAGVDPVSDDTTWRPVCGERAEIRSHYNGAVVRLKEHAPPGREMDIEFRAYDEGVAFRYRMPKPASGADKITISGELTEFRFPGDHPAFVTYAPQSTYQKIPLSKIKGGAEGPLTVETGATGFVSLGEAGVVDFARMRFDPLGDKSPGLRAKLYGKVTSPLPLTTPWRVIVSASTPGKLLENNTIFPNLNPPCAIADTSWIKPGNVLREVTLTTAGAMRTIDFCAAHKIPYMMFDAGWYGHEWDKNADASQVSVDPKRSKGPLDLPGIIRYGESKGVGVILYVNFIAMSKQLDEILPIYRKWGVKGVKYGFVSVGPQNHTAFMSRAIRLAAENRLMVDIHDNWRPTGTERTWPNLMTVEGIRGDEEKDRSNAQSLTHLFTRFVAGPADNTLCYFDARVDRLCDHAYQMGKLVCFYSPLQSIYWYDKPAPEGASLKSGDNLIGDEPELSFFDRMPTVWDETRVLAGEIGAFAVVARRTGDSWRVGVMNSETPREAKISLGFLAPGKSYEATLYTNDPATPTRTHVKIERRRVDATSEITLAIGKNSGAAIEIFPAKE